MTRRTRVSFKEYAKPIDPDAAIATFDRKAAVPQDWLPLFEKLTLSRAQGVDLAFMLRHALQDLKQGRPPVEKRKHQVARLKTFGRLTGNLRYDVDRASVDLEEALPWSVRRALVQLMRRSAMEKAIGGPLPVWIGDQDLDALSDLDEEALAIKFGVTFLKHWIAEVDEPLQAWLMANRLNRGKRPPLAGREYLLIRFAFFWEKVRGAPPSARGEFQACCFELFRFLELDEAGLERAVDRVTERFRAVRAESDRNVGRKR